MKISKFQSKNSQNGKKKRQKKDSQKLSTVRIALVQNLPPFGMLCISYPLHLFIEKIEDDKL